MADTEQKITLELIGARSIVDGLERSAEALIPFRERLVAMGWTDEMAGAFMGDVAETIVRHLITVEPLDGNEEFMRGCGQMRC